MGTIWGFYFGWYQGAVYSNLLASGICAALVWWRARVHLARAREQHARHLADQHEATRAHLAEHAEALAGQIAAVHVRLDALASPATQDPDPHETGVPDADR